MILESNLNQVAKEIEEYKIAMKRKLENMVRGFTTELTFKAISATPLGNSAKYPDMYKNRTPSWLPNEEGFARGSWQASIVPSVGIQRFKGVGSGQDAYNEAKSYMQQYSLGQTVYIINKGPYIDALNRGSSLQAAQGIMSQIQAPQIYSINLQYYFDKG